MPVLSIVIPAYNEAATIHLILDKVRDCALPEGWTKELIVVNDCSKDATEEAIERYTAIKVKALDRHGVPFSFEAHGWSARVVQHELDHLNGVLIIDRTDRESRREALKALRPKPSLA